MFFKQQMVGIKLKINVAKKCNSLNTPPINNDQLLNEQLAILNSRIVGMVKLKKKEIFWCNDEFAHLFGYTSTELMGQSIKKIFISNKEDVCFWLAANAVMNYGKVFRQQLQLKNKNGTLDWYEANGEKPQSNCNESVWAFINISKHKRYEQKIHQLAFFDVLTNLPNRRLLYERLNQTLSSSKRSRQFGALMMLDLDYFKLVNDTFGHGAGDGLLKEVGQRLKENIRSHDTVARIGGDEFIVLVTLLGTNLVNAKLSAAIIAEKLRFVLEAPYQNITKSNDGDRKSSARPWCTASIGVVMFPQEIANCDEYLKWADDAMYTVKKNGGNCVKFYEG
ncbi:diguanylate cyclase domain-containing protein [Zwartia sp.]|uniref:diguanylate cyclase domain-containing protein n=1 Tax=Zwartia sp. TaxID=2978004 RepID=UPI003BB1934B